LELSQFHRFPLLYIVQILRNLPFSPSQTHCSYRVFVPPSHLSFHTH
jgi:hypothetical protein